MKFNISLLSFFLLMISISCSAQKNIDSSNEIRNQLVSDTTFANINDYSNDFVLDFKYGTEDNFLKYKVYDCSSCYLRLKTIKSLINANNEFKKKGYKIKLFDCYRPLSVQKKMWAIVPDANYVANPAKGSIHNRGGAVDMTIVDKNGNDLDMGTLFDFFGPESSHNYTKFPKKVLKNRLLLKKIMLNNHFESFDSEWWHYNLVGSKKDNLSNFNWDCK